MNNYNILFDDIFIELTHWYSNGTYENIPKNMPKQFIKDLDHICKYYYKKQINNISETYSIKITSESYLEYIPLTLFVEKWREYLPPKHVFKDTLIPKNICNSPIFEYDLFYPNTPNCIEKNNRICHICGENDTDGMMTRSIEKYWDWSCDGCYDNMIYSRNERIPPAVEQWFPLLKSLRNQKNVKLFAIKYWKSLNIQNKLLHIRNTRYAENSIDKWIETNNYTNIFEERFRL